MWTSYRMKFQRVRIQRSGDRWDSELGREESGGYTGKPLPTYRPASQLVPLGGAARLFCEAYLGKVELPDAKNSVTWSKSDSNVTLPSHGRIAQHRVSRNM
uniref:Ig-like domain-containing protein n=1 Tax=Vespula pensylvanica TaxID=30213 RepID=A0A834P0C0_VESPE|nr:hypothetical protein H0235_009989 [Vespula pensylvanica]